MAFQVNYNNGAKAEVVQADDYAHEERTARSLPSGGFKPDGAATTFENVLTVRTADVDRIEPV
jgi:hypothetical protein